MSNGTSLVIEQRLVRRTARERHTKGLARALEDMLCPIGVTAGNVSIACYRGSASFDVHACSLPDAVRADQIRLELARRANR